MNLFMNEDKALLVVQMEEISRKSHMIQTIKHPQIIHMYSYDMHLLSSKYNIETLMYYVERFKIDYVCVNIPITKYIDLSKELISRLHMECCNAHIIASGEAITQEISIDIGADAYSYDGNDLIRVIDGLEEKEEMMYGIYNQYYERAPLTNTEDMLS